jgi:hypothetical protein
MGLRLDRVAAERLEPVLRIAVLLHHLVVLVTGRRSYALSQIRKANFELGNLGRAAHHRVEHAALADLSEFLRQVADLHPLRSMHLARVRLLLAQKDLNKGGLARSVVANKGGAATGREGDGDVAKQHLCPEGFAESADSNHKP